MTRPRLRTLAGVFLRLGATSFGGPAAHVALMEDEIVRRRGWLDRRHFLDLVGAANLVPGPNSTEVAIHVGRVQRGAAGLVVAGACFILPAFAIVCALAWAYVRYGGLPPAVALLDGAKPVAVVVVAQALWRFGGTVAARRSSAWLAVAAGLALLAGVHELAVLALAGLAGLLLRGVPAPAALPAFVLALPASAAAAPVAFGLWPLFLFFLKVGAVLYGSGYVLLAFLRADLVERWGWLTDRQLLDAVAIGQVTPGPLFTTATFVGWLLGGAPGAVVATVGIFLPAFLFVALTAPLLDAMRRSPALAALLDGVQAASLALMAVVAWRLAAEAFTGAPGVAIGVAAAAALAFTRVNPAWLMLGGALLGLARGAWGGGG